MTEGLYLMTLENDAKFEEKQSCFWTIFPFVITIMKSKQLPFIEKFICLAILSINSGFKVLCHFPAFPAFCFFVIEHIRKLANQGKF